MFNFPTFTFHRENPIYPNLIPNEIWNVPEPPQTLYVQGKPEALQLLHQIPARGLAIVGTRNPRLRSKAFLTREIELLEGSSLIIISGLARGIDAAAHEAAIKAGLPTIAVIGAGLDIDYPRENYDLRNEILNHGGLVISEFPATMPAQGFHFLKRNRLIAGWSQATWVVEAGLRSGSLNTARWAREWDRPCFALPSFPGDVIFSGNQILLDRDHAFSYWGVHSLGAVWIELVSHVERRQVKTKPSFTPDELKIRTQIQLACSEKGGIQVQELLRISLDWGWAAERFFQVLGRLLARNQAVEHKGVIVTI